jgi:hypothetical protein
MCGPCYQQPRLRVTKTITERGREVSKYVDHPCENTQYQFNRLIPEIKRNIEAYGYDQCFIISKWDQRSCKWVDIYEV